MVFTLAPQTIPLRCDAGGTLRVGETRVTLESVIYAHQSGASAVEIGQRFPTLALADIHLVLGYYLNHRESVERYLETQNEKAQQMRALIESRFGSQDALREELIARRALQAREEYASSSDG